MTKLVIGSISGVLGVLTLVWVILGLFVSNLPLPGGGSFGGFMFSLILMGIGAKWLIEGRRELEAKARTKKKKKWKPGAGDDDY